MPGDDSAPNAPPPSSSSSSPGAELPLTTIESFIAAMVEAGPEVAEHMVRAAQELLLAAQALVSAAERNLAEQRRAREEAPHDADASSDGSHHTSPAADGPALRSVDEVA
jgi:hypothetical protein